ncbi:MAG: hypothetical protein L6R19_00660 [Alphaproteobacteria bacterium]|nr:hypothetical protein [Alphaproteobacteria bacterium]
MTMLRIAVAAPILALLLGLGAAPPAPALADTIQQSALKDGCKKRYATNKRKYNECISGNSKASTDALIEGCYLRYNAVKDKLRECLGR